MENNKYLIQCKSCGRILFKVGDPMIQLLNIEIKCPQCGKLLKIKENTVITAIKKRGLDNIS